MDKKILASETKIKATPNASSGLINSPASLEKDYNDMRRKMDEYNEKCRLSLKIKSENE
ncbi:MAG: hypothetical protein HYZ42_07690 [Bacteroidetes bacterium]|nr:hypothetical protein [Bacteroidota bacterium]